jgi:hypothetical protein
MSAIHTGHRHSEATRQKMSNTRTGHITSTATRKKISAKLKGRKILWSDKIAKTVLAQSKEISTRMKALWKKPEFRRAITDKNKTFGNLPQEKSRRSKEQKTRWSDPFFAERVVRATFDAANKTPNGAERKLMQIIESVLPGEYTFVGDGTVLVGRRCPDYISSDHKKLIELFGDYWHRGKNPQDRIDYFTRYGYKTLVVWESELDNMDLLRNRIVQFHSGA